MMVSTYFIGQFNVLNDAYIEFAGVGSPSSMAKNVMKAIEDVYETPLFQLIV